MSSALKSGDIVAGRYEVEEVLGKGGMGIVVAARDQQLDRCVALKVLSEEHVRNREAVTRFMQEARAAVRLTSDHVVRVFDIGTLPGDIPYMVMEMLRGADLSQVLASEGAVPITDAIGFLVQACEAVGEAHFRGIVHRDLKPANLFLSRQVDGTSRIKVLDFGISKLTASGDEAETSLTHTAWMLGSPVYMSPEQLRSARDVDGRADIWALGTILFELVVGKPPFLGNSVAELSAKILIEPAPTPSKKKGSPLPSGLDEVILKALEKNIEHRYQSIEEFTLALQPYAPRRCEPNLDRIARLRQPSGKSEPSTVSTSENAPTSESPHADGAETFLDATHVGWEKTAPPNVRRLALRKIAATVGAAIITGAGLGVLLSPASPAEPPEEVTSGPVPAARIEMDFPMLTPPKSWVTLPPEGITPPQAAAAQDDEPTVDAGTATKRQRKSHVGVRHRRSTQGGLLGEETPLREEFGGRK